MAMKRKPYKTEEQICDWLGSGEGRDLLGELCPVLTGGIWCREKSIAHLLRPDFIHVSGNRLDIIEVKITADIEAVSQISEYLYVSRQHTLEHWYEVMSPVFDVSQTSVFGVLIARYFDISVFRAALAANIRLLQVTVDQSGYFDLTEPENPLDREPDKAFLSFLKLHFHKAVVKHG